METKTKYNKEKSQIHKMAKERFYLDLTENIPHTTLNDFYVKYLWLSESAPTEVERQIAKILTKRFNDILLIIWK